MNLQLCINIHESHNPPRQFSQKFRSLTNLTDTKLLFSADSLSIFESLVDIAVVPLEIVICRTILLPSMLLQEQWKPFIGLTDTMSIHG